MTRRASGSTGQHSAALNALQGAMDAFTKRITALEVRVEQLEARMTRAALIGGGGGVFIVEALRIVVEYLRAGGHG